MPDWLQHLLVLSLVALSAAFVLWQTVRTLGGKGGNVGSCCAKGCDPARPGQAVQSPASAQPRAQRVVFMPVEMLTRRR